MRNLSKCLCILSVLFLSVLIVSASQPKIAPVTMVLNEDQLNETVVLSTNTVALIRLPVNPSTGYAWYMEPENSILKLVADEVDEKGIAIPSYDPVEVKGISLAPGSPRTQVFRIVGLQQGSTVLTLLNKRLWVPGYKDIKYISFYSEGPFTGELVASKASPTYTPPPAEEIMAPGVPAHFNWAEQGKVTAVRNQGSCGSCWAFGTVAAFEAKILIKDGVSRDLSEQYLVSCNNNGFNCSGGWWGHDYHYNKYISPNTAAGARYESDFPYQAVNAACKATTARERLDGWAYTDDVADTAFPSKAHWPTVAQIKQKIYDYGPVATDVDASSWGSYTGGVWSHTGSAGNHIVLITGWDDTYGCFYIKNSWGSSFGESGYIRLAYGSDLVGHNSTYVKYREGGTTVPTITTQPTSKTVAVGATATFSVAASGTAPLSYQWYKNNAAISGATAANYTTPAATTADNGATFYVKVSNSAGNVNSNTVTLTVTSGGGGALTNGVAVAVSGAAGSLTNYYIDVPSGSTNLVMATSGGTGDLDLYTKFGSVPTTSSYDCRPYASGNNETCTVASPSAGRYYIMLYGYSAYSGASLKASFSTSSGVPVITTQPVNKTVAVGGTTTFSVVASNATSYQWYKRSVAISGATAANYTTPAATTADNGATFYVRVSNSVGSVNSNTVTLTVGSTPSTLAVVSPNGGEQWARGSVNAIRWSAPASTTKIDIALYRGTTFVQWITWNLSATSGTYNWTIPTSLAAGTTYKVMILDYNVRTLQDYSDAAFQLY